MMTLHADTSVSSSLVMFSIDQRRFAVPLSSVERVLPAKEIRPVAGGSARLLGFTLLADRPVPVLNLRRHLGLTERPVRPSDRFLLVRSGHRVMALVAEESEEGDEIPGPTGAAVAAPVAEGVIRMDNGLTLIFDFERLFGRRDQEALDQMIHRRQTRRAAVAAAAS